MKTAETQVYGALIMGISYSLSEERIMDSMDLEREKGITIKSHAIQINYKHTDGQEYILNLIDTPGHVDFSYEKARQILFGVSFTIPAGHRVAVVGHSGSGKSTLARLLYRFYDVSGGHLEINGVDVRELKQASLRAAIGIVPQDTVLFNDTILYNIRYGRPDASDEEIFEAARAAHIHDFIQTLPSNYQTAVGERGLKLSGGEKQRVAIARALLKNPRILIFDEATSALDSRAEKAIQAELERISQGRTTLVIAHRLSTVMDADQILVLSQGRIIERGTHAQLLEAKGEYARMWALQQQQAQAKEILESTTAS